jgi:hypothetical protein
MLNHRNGSRPDLPDYPNRPPDAIQPEARGLELRHQIGALVVQPQRLVLVEEPMTSELLLKGCLLILQELAMDEPLLTRRADGQCRRPRKSSPTLTAKAPGTNGAPADAVDTALARMAPVADASELGYFSHRAMASRAPVGGAFRGLLHRTSSIIRQTFGLHG